MLGGGTPPARQARFAVQENFEGQSGAIARTLRPAGSIAVLSLDEAATFPARSLLITCIFSHVRISSCCRVQLAQEARGVANAAVNCDGTGHRSRSVSPRGDLPLLIGPSRLLASPLLTLIYVVLAC
jgi:hypothetical protein